MADTLRFGGLNIPVRCATLWQEERRKLYRAKIERFRPFRVMILVLDLSPPE